MEKPIVSCLSLERNLLGKKREKIASCLVSKRKMIKNGMCRKGGKAKLAYREIIFHTQKFSLKK